MDRWPTTKFGCAKEQDVAAESSSLYKGRRSPSISQYFTKSHFRIHSHRSNFQRIISSSDQSSSRPLLHISSPLYPSSSDLYLFKSLIMKCNLAHLIFVAAQFGSTGVAVSLAHSALEKRQTCGTPIQLGTAADFALLSNKVIINDGTSLALDERFRRHRVWNPSPSSLFRRHIRMDLFHSERLERPPRRSLDPRYIDLDDDSGE